MIVSKPIITGSGLILKEEMNNDIFRKKNFSACSMFLSVQIILEHKKNLSQSGSNLACLPKMSILAADKSHGFQVATSIRKQFLYCNFNICFKKKYINFRLKNCGGTSLCKENVKALVTEVMDND